MKILVSLFNLHLKVIYFFFKLFKIQEKIVFITRQTDKQSLDFRLLIEKINKDYPNIRVVALCKKWKTNFIGLVSNYFFLYKHMYHLATSKVCIVNTYVPTVSILKHKKGLKIMQIWHSLGAVKKFGKQSLGTVSGRSEGISEGAKMHEGYDAIISTSEQTSVYYSEAFGYPLDKFLNYGLPRIDYMIEQKEILRKKIYESYPEFKEKKVIMYAPTFRTTGEDNAQKLADAIDLNKYHLIIYEHYLQKLSFDKNKIYSCNEFLPNELLAVTDYLITDYSAISIEAAVYNVKTLYYVFDYEDYDKNNGINMNVFKIMPGCAFKEEKALSNKINSNDYDMNLLNIFRKDYLPKNLGKSTELIVNIIIKWYNSY